MLIERKGDLIMIHRWRNQDVIKVITGIRRCEKSTLLKLFQRELLREGIPETRIVTIHLEDDGNMALRDPVTLHISAATFL